MRERDRESERARERERETERERELMGSGRNKREGEQNRSDRQTVAKIHVCVFCPPACCHVRVGVPVEAGLCAFCCGCN